MWNQCNIGRSFDRIVYFLCVYPSKAFLEHCITKEIFASEDLYVDICCVYLYIHIYFLSFTEEEVVSKKKKNKNISSILINWFFPPLTFSSFIMLHMYVVLSSQIMTCDCVYNFTLNCFDIHVHYMYFITMLCLTCII